MRIKDRFTPSKLNVGAALGAGFLMRFAGRLSVGHKMGLTLGG